ncbi:MAG: hypothetical protein WC430_01770 [Patescibacteria group bacterium]
MIIPAILVNTFGEFETQIKKMEKNFTRVQIDVMDGKFTPNKSFADAKKINGLKTKTKYELHLMVDDPLAEIKKWKKVKKIYRVVFHIESKSSPEKTISAIRKRGWQVGIAVNPETSLDKIKPYRELANLILFMTARPGHQGAKFLPKMKEKINKFKKFLNERTTKKNSKTPAIAVDGGIKKSNIGDIKKSGADIFYIGSALSMAKDAKLAYNTLKKKLANS